MHSTDYRFSLLLLETDYRSFPRLPARRHNFSDFSDIFAVARRSLILPAAAEVVKQVVPVADLRYFDGGHFVLDEYAEAIAEAIIETFSR